MSPRWWRALFGGHGGPVNRYAVRFEPDGAGVLTARGDVSRLVPVVMDAMREWSGPVGMALVVYRDRPEEWVASGLPRGRALEGLLRIRDLIGAGGLDLAVFSEIEALSVYVDRFGILEARGLGDGLDELGTRLIAAGFARVSRVSAVPPAPDPNHAWTVEDAARVEETAVFLQLFTARASEGDTSADGS